LLLASSDAPLMQDFPVGDPAEFLSWDPPEPVTGGAGGDNSYASFY